MNVDDQLLFFFSALGTFNASILSIYFIFFAKPKHVSNYFLGGLLAALSIRIWKSVFLFFNPEISKVYLQIGLTACFFIGPFLYLYVKSKTSTDDNNQKYWKYLPIFLLAFVIVFGSLYPFHENADAWKSVIYKIINYQWLVFIIASAFLLKDILKKLLFSKSKLDHDEVWILSVFFGVFIIWLAYFTSTFTSYIVGALSFSMVLYLSILLIYHHKKYSTPKQVNLQKYANHKIDKSEEKQLLTKIESLMEEQQLYKNPNLYMAELAQKLNIRSHILSQLLNDNLNKSFSQFVNEYRVEEAKEILKNEHHLKMEVIAEQCGFNSNSTFYASFKKITKMTPAQYARSNES